jgi:Eco29kI restriction endonuclease
MPSTHLFNPLDKKNLGESIVNALEKIPPVKLSNLTEFKGAGIYALYYAGAFAPYAVLAKLNDTLACFPIYVGKAVAAGARKGNSEVTGLDSKALWLRLREHAESIAAVKELKVAEFSCKYLIIDEIWIGLGESLLIQAYSPLWNVSIEGFGNHDPGAGRAKGRRPAWDELHNGRAWAKRLQPAKHSREELLAIIHTHMSKL